MKRVFVSVFLLLVLVALTSIPDAVLAVEEFRISTYGGGVQIWFEAEAFDERNPEGDRYFPVTGDRDVTPAPKGAFEEAVTRAGGAGGRISWTFDISRADGEEGDWYFWARVANPGNLSDYMLVEGDSDDKNIPAEPPFPGGDAVAPLDNADDRIFESTVAAWGWWGNSEGSFKELQDGENTMHIFHRQGSNTVFWDVFMWTDDPSYRPTDDDYTKATPMLRDMAVDPAQKLSTTWASIKK